MRVFKTFNQVSDTPCPICKTKDLREVVLIGIQGTQEDKIIEAAQFHLDCLEFLFDKERGFIYQII